jgi:SagB-type dehydrogenase family enzyme
MALEEVLAARRSVRSFRPDEPVLADVGQLLWAAQGITHAGRLRAAPSAGALYALELYVAGSTRTLRYLPDGHRAEIWADRDERAALAAAGRNQPALVEAPLIVVVTATPSRLAGKYGSRAGRFADLEAGHATHGLLLQAVALGLGAVSVGAFEDAVVASVLDLAVGEGPRYLVAVGAPAED